MGLGDFFGSIGGAITTGLGAFAGGVRSSVGGIFDSIISSRPPSLPSGAGANVFGEFGIPGIAGPSRTSQVLRDIGTGLSGIALQSVAASLVPQQVQRTAPQFQGPLINPNTGTLQRQGTRQAGFELGTGRPGGGLQQANVLGDLLGLPSVQNVRTSFEESLVGRGLEAIGFGGSVTRPATNMPGGALVVGGNGSGVTLPSGGFFFGASQNLMTGNVTVRAKNHLRMINPATGDCEHWLRAIPPPLRLWKIAGRHRGHSHRHSHRRPR